MKYISTTIAIILGQFLGNMIKGTPHIFRYYFFSLIVALLLLFGFDKLCAKEFHRNAYIEIEYLREFIKYDILTPQQREFYLDKIDFHESNAKRTYEDAKNRCWWLPDVSDRDKARYCITSMGVLCQPGTPQSRVIKTLITLLVQYGIDCLSEWEYIQNKLHWSEYHWEMYEFYCEVLING